MPLGHIFERRDPAAFGQGPLGDGQHVPVGEREDLGGNLLLCDAAHHVGDILLDIALEASDRRAVLENFAEQAARLHEGRIHPEHLDIALIADNETKVAIPHAKALRHVGKRELDLRILPAEPEHHPEHDPDHEQDNRSDPGRVEISQRPGQCGNGVRHGCWHPSVGGGVSVPAIFLRLTSPFFLGSAAGAIPQWRPWCSVRSKGRRGAESRVQSLAITRKNRGEGTRRTRGT